MPEATFYTAAAKKKGSVELPADFGVGVNKAILYDAVRAYLSNQRQGTHSTKTRSEVSGGGRKPFRQKGTGRARQGTIRAPQLRGGGVVFGPKPRSYRIDLPRKVRSKARQSALSARAEEAAVYVIESLDFPAPKTAQLVDILDKMEVADRKVLLLTNGNNPQIFLSSRNLWNVLVVRYSDACAYDVLWSEVVVIEQGALTDSDKEHPVPRPTTKRKSVKRTRGKANAEKGGEDA